ncbi:MAG: DUF4198 domain-containing protein [Planctomycetaceae bacterium]|nr:DUF4198 domain-containing protein [Planctomycetaceae bacterium]
MLSFTGCSDSPFRVETVEGTVTLDGQPCADAVLTFIPVDDSAGKAAYGRTDDNGVYKLTASNGGKSNAGAKAGKYIVSILKEVPSREPTAKELADREKGISVEIPNISVIPVKYNNANASGLTADVVAGKNTFNFELKSK